jgi:hypothetical protein
MDMVKVDMSCNDNAKLIWDGSYLGRFDKEDIISRKNMFPYNRYTVVVKMDGMSLTIDCTMATASNLYPCIVDEIKPILGLVKIGTHSVRYGKTLYIMYNMPYECRLLTEDEAKTGEECTDLKIMVQDTYVFRLVVGLGCNFDSSIALVNGVPTSYRCTCDIKGDMAPDMSRKAQQFWFVDSVKDSIHRMVACCGRSYTMRCKIQDVINRIDKSLIWLDNYIYGRFIQLNC